MNNKCIVITGASDGIGKALAFNMAERGYNLGLTARRLEVLQELKSDLEGKHPGINVAIAAVDVCDYSRVEPVLTELFQQLGQVNILLVNAGIAKAGRVGVMPLEDNLAVINTNLNGAIATVSAGLKLFREQGFGHLVATSSIAAYRGMPRNAAYSASKAGLSTFMEGVRAETCKENIDITVLHPGFIDTAINRGLASRPFVIDVEQGAKLFAELIEKKVQRATVPSMPWALVGPLLARLPTSVIAKL